MLRVSMLSLSKRCHSQNVVSVCTVNPPLQFIRVHTKNLCRPNNDSLRPWTAIPHLSLDTDLVSAALQWNGIWWSFMHTVFCLTSWTVLFRHDTDGICPCTSVDNQTDAAAIWWVLVSAAASARSFISATAFYILAFAGSGPWLWPSGSSQQHHFSYGSELSTSFYYIPCISTWFSQLNQFFPFEEGNHDANSRGTAKKKKKKKFCQYNEIWIETDWHFPKTDWLNCRPNEL